MTCSTCVKMTVANEEMEQELILLRQRNKVLVSVNRVLRDRVTNLQEEFDNFIEELYEAENSTVTVSD